MAILDKSLIRMFRKMEEIRRGPKIAQLVKRRVPGTTHFSVGEAANVGAMLALNRMSLITSNHRGLW